MRAMIAALLAALASLVRVRAACATVRAFKRTGRANLIAARRTTEQRDGFQLFLDRAFCRGYHPLVRAVRWCRWKSIHEAILLASAIRSPRPAPWTYSTGLCVSRNQMMQSTSGTSNPVAGASTVTRQHVRRGETMLCVAHALSSACLLDNQCGMPRWLSRRQTPRRWQPRWQKGNPLWRSTASVQTSSCRSW